MHGWNLRKKNISEFNEGEVNSDYAEMWNIY